MSEGRRSKPATVAALRREGEPALKTLIGLDRQAHRKRRSREEIAELCSALRDILEKHRPMTVRQVFYQAVSAGLIEKTENEYKNVVVRLLTKMRKDGQIPFGWIADHTRWMRKPRTFSSLEAAVEHTARTYGRALWDTQEVYVEVWLEKDALAGVLLRETTPWDVPLMVTRGYPSVSYLYEAAEAIGDCGKPTYIYYFDDFGDYDPSGLDISRNVEEGLREYAPYAEIHFERTAVTVQQIEELNLPTRLTKRTDSRAKRFEGESVEVDAIAPDTLRSIVSERILQHIDHEQLEVLKIAERSEREALQMWGGEWRSDNLL